MAARLLIIRHGESNATVNGTIGGPRTCSGLTELGRRQVQALTDRWLAQPELGVTRLLSSEYPRAIETAEILRPALDDLPVERDAAWGEIDPGPSADGRRYEDFFREFSRSPDDWDKGGPYQRFFPDGETVAELNLRVGLATRQLVDALGPDGAAVIATHGGVIEAMLRQALEASMMGDFRLFTSNASITELIWTDQSMWRIGRYNDAAHIHGLNTGP